MSSHAKEIAGRQRFEFGKNWTQFLTLLDESRIAEAEKSLRQMLEVESLAGKRFLDIGSGSGLFSLAAKRLGASVHSFDYDPQSVACTSELKRRYFPNDPDWVVEEGSALDAAYVQSLGKFDIVYSWGVLHHTGQMWQALESLSAGWRGRQAVHCDLQRHGQPECALEEDQRNIQQIAAPPASSLCAGGECA